MTYAVIDVETTIFKKGNPFADRNRLCMVGVRINGQNHTFTIEYDSEPYAEKLLAIQALLDSCDLLVGFNLKFDLNWLRRYGIKFDSHRVFDLQLTEFILAGQQPAYPSLDYCLAKYGLGAKYDVVAVEYWGIGMDTTSIPLEILTHYLEEDLRLTDELYKVLFPKIPTSLQSLITLSNQDLLVLGEMEWNGIKLNWQRLKEQADHAEAELAIIRRGIGDFIPEDSRQWFNIESGDHLSCLLFGGCISRKVGTPYDHKYKTGSKIGQTATRYRWDVIHYEFPRLCNPPKGSELKKEGFFSTDEETLQSLPKPKKLINLLLKHAELSKLLNTYLLGLPKIRENYDWKDEMLHGTFNQCRVITGRLSSEKPNLQNMPPSINQYIETRYGK